MRVGWFELWSPFGFFVLGPIGVLFPLQFNIYLHLSIWHIVTYCNNILIFLYFINGREIYPACDRIIINYHPTVSLSGSNPLDTWKEINHKNTETLTIAISHFFLTFLSPFPFVPLAWQLSAILSGSIFMID